MVNLNFTEEKNAFFESVGNSRTLTLATSAKDSVTGRTMSVVVLDGLFYMQTDKTMLKFRQMEQNPCVALSFDNVSIEGVAELLGHPLDAEHSKFRDRFETAFPSAYRRYTSPPDERLIRITPKKATFWLYLDDEPYRKTIDFENESAALEPYLL